MEPTLPSNRSFGWTFAGIFAPAAAAVHPGLMCEASELPSVSGVPKNAHRPKVHRGAATVEFALVCVAFLLLLLAIMELGILFWVNLSMQHAVRESARYAVTGQANLDPNAASQQRYRAVIHAAKNGSMGLYEAVRPTVTVILNGGSAQTYGNPNMYDRGMFGGPGDIVVLQLNCVWPVMTPLLKPFFSDTGGEYRFSVAATMRNESF